jgi:hypothetical protein
MALGLRAVPQKKLDAKTWCRCIAPGYASWTGPAWKNCWCDRGESCIELPRVTSVTFFWAGHVNNFV